MIIPLLLANSLSTRNTFYLCKAYVGWLTTDRINDVEDLECLAYLRKFVKIKATFVWVFWKTVNECKGESWV